jgi:hypothetical protein
MEERDFKQGLLAGVLIMSTILMYVLLLILL